MSLRDNLLLVEGKDDQRIVPELVESAGIPWGPLGDEIVRIHETDGYEKLAANSNLSSKTLDCFASVFSSMRTPIPLLAGGRWRPQ